MKFLGKLTDKDFGGSLEVTDGTIHNCVRAVLFNENDKIALMYMPEFIRNNSEDFYVLPGGRVEKNETVEEALKREIFEETGCTFNVINELGYFEINSIKDKFAGHIYYYLLKVTGDKKEPQMTDEEVRFKTQLYWYSLEEALNYIVNQKVYDNMWLVFLKHCDNAVISSII